MIMTQPTLTEAQWSLIRELLERERQELPGEIHHTDSREYAHLLDERRTLIEDLIHRLETPGYPA